ncbi:MAG: hypothetical protein OHK0019_28880 [Saprospiraceae bacterium]
MKILPLFLLFANIIFAQTDSTQQLEKKPMTLLRQLDSATVWEGVRIATEQFFQEKNATPSFKIKNREKRKSLVAAIEGQFQINASDDDIKSFKRAKDLSNYVFRAQQGVVFFSKNNFQGKVERLATDRKNCDENADCLNFIGSLLVPKGWRVTLFSQPKFKGEKLTIDATNEEIRITSFIKIDFTETISATNHSLNWREETRSIRIQKLK